MKRKALGFALLFGGALSLSFFFPVTAVAQKGNTAKSDMPAKTEKIIVIDEDGNSKTYYPNDVPQSVERVIKGSASAINDASASTLSIAGELFNSLDLSGLVHEVTRTLSDVRVSDFAVQIDRALETVDWREINLQVDNTLEDLHRELSNPELKKDLKETLQQAQDELSLASEDAKIDVSIAREKLKSARRNIQIAREERERKERASEKGKIH